MSDRTTTSYWRSVERLLDSPALEPGTEEEGRPGASRAQAPSPEFPAGADEAPDGVTRRTMLGLMGASFGLAGMTACRRPVEHIVPYVDAPEGVLPGVAERYATTLTFGTEAYGAVVESHEGRPTKVEGNDLHPGSRGASSAWMQATVLDLYDPDRSRSVMHRASAESGADGEGGPSAGGGSHGGAGAAEDRGGSGHEPSDWDAFAAFWSEASSEDRAPAGRGLAVLTESFASPTMARLARRFAERYPEARLAVHDPVGDENRFAGIEAATGTARRPVLHLERATTVLALDADLLLTESDALAAARGFAAGRRAGLGEANGDGGSMNRLYAVESALSLTGANADHRVALPSSRIGAFAAALAERLGVAEIPDGLAGPLPEEARARLDLIADDLRAAGPDALVAAGRRQPPAVHALVHAVNQALGAVGRTVTLHDLADVGWGRVADLAELAQAMTSGTVDTLVILGGNPVYDAPGAAGFAEALRATPHTVHLSDRLDETSRLCEWHLPRAHALEAWGDARAADGTPSVAQPLIAPLFGGRSALEVLAMLAGEETWQGATQVQRTWGVEPSAPGEDPARPGSPWRRVLHDGVATAESAPELAPEPGPPVTVRRPETVATQAEPGAAGAGADGSDLELVFLVSPSVREGRFANNAWLQEAPDPLTRITWDNAALVSPATAGELGIETGDVVRLRVESGEESREIEIPAWVSPGQADRSVAVELGFGRTAAGRVGDRVGVDAYPLRGLADALFATGVTAEPTGRRAELVQTQEHWEMEGRGLVREASLGEYREHPEFARGEHDPPLAGTGPEESGSLWREPNDGSDGESHQWGMVIDLASCIGCGACVTACQAENNVPVVGKEQVSRGREMQWLRVDRYYSGEASDPRVVFQTVPCMHCENAPCEQVCPVAATVHDDEGLNAMVYNRCIGTRYCSNNCPYKVRRFNFFNYTNETPELVKLAMNPDVTVRSRGVMEKCTYCVQRINEGKAESRKRGRPLADGDVTTACQQACPAEAIVFGDLADETSRVHRAKRDPRGYALLAELNNQPRTTYLAKVRNPNPEWPSAPSGPGAGHGEGA
ncbi:MAG: Fe-S-cluster-containing hydrogenase [Acidobacteriota bacterium]|jgi:molybdopterin-containing oxidoreductase family iron-sulfur binding subunit